MPDLNHKFQAGKMNKDLDERLVPNGEYRDALNVEVATSDDSDVGTLQNILGNLDISSELFIDPATNNIMDEAVLDTYGFYCVGSIADEKNDKLYWLVSGVGIDFIAEYDYNTKKVHPIVVDIFQANVLPGDGGRVLNFDKGFLITGINIMEETIFWTDNNTEPKRVNIPQIRLGTVDFLTHTVFYVPNPDKTSSVPFVAAGDLQEGHITVIRKGPNTAPKLEMKNTKVGDMPYSGSMSGEITTTYSKPLTFLWDSNTGAYINTSETIEFDSNPDFKKGDFLDIESMDSVTGTSKKRKITVEIIADPILLPSGELQFEIEVRSWDTNIDLDNEDFNVTLQQDSSLFKFRFPRFGCRYKYKDGEYSAFSPFSEIAFLPGEFDYLPKEGYNLAMVNTVRALGVCDFVDERYIPEDVISIDILYKESDSPAVYSIKTVDRLPLDPTDYDSWNAVTSTTMRDTSVTPPIQTYGYVDIESEMIHSILPDNQLLRPWDNVPKKALAQEIIGNRIVYANYLQNYNLSSSHTQNPSALTNVALQKSKNIEVDLKVVLKQKEYSLSNTIAEELDAGKAYTYESAKTIKSLRTYQLGVIYIDEFGRETPVFSSSKDSRHTISVKKDSAGKATKLAVQIHSPQPDFAKNFKFLVKETSSEYYNLAMDRWYNADDGNIWITFPSADRNKVDLETFLILKKAHKTNDAVTDLARYKILDIKNEAPRFVKTRRTPIRTVNDGVLSATSTTPILMDGGNEDTDFPFTGGRFVDIHEDMVEAVIDTFESEVGSAYPFQFRIVSAEGASKWYDIQNFESRLSGSETYWRIISTENFGDDMAITTPFNVAISPAEPAYGNCKVEFIKREEKNLPEFEGRFFVKILKDSELQENILGYSSYTGNWSSSSSIKSQYINAYSDVSEFSSASNPANWYGCDPMKISIDENTQDTNFYAPSSPGEGQAYWDLAGQTSNTASESSGWFIDSIEAFREFQYTRYYSKSLNDFEGGQPGNSYLADWGTPPVPGEPNPYKYILNQMQSGSIPSPFIDNSGDPLPPIKHIAPTPTQNMTFITHGGGQTNNQHINNAWTNEYSNYEWDDPFKQLQLIGDLGNWNAKDETGAHVYANGAGGNWNNYLGISNVNSLVLDNTANNGTAIPRIRAAAAANGGKIIPASGIDTDNNIIHLSYAGLGYENKAAEDLANNFWNLDVRSKFEDYTDPATTAKDYVNDINFITSITTPGTVWRWKEDPGQIMYQTKAGPPSGGDINTPEWNVSQRDHMDTGMGVRLWNYAKIADYMTTHRLDFFVGNDSKSEHIPNFASQGIQNYGLVWSDWNIWGNAIPIASNTVSWSNLAKTSGGVWTLGGPIYDLNHKEFWIQHENGSGSFPRMTPQGFWPMYTQDWNDASCSRRRFTIHAKALANAAQGTNGTEGLGTVGPHKYLPTNPTGLAAHFGGDGEVLASIPSNIAPGIRPDGMYSGRDNVVGNYPLINAGTTNNFSKIPSKKMTDGTNTTPAPGSVTWQILEKYELNSGAGDAGYFTSNPAVWETEPKDDLGLEIYHEVGQIYPTELNEKTLEQFFGPIHTDISRNSKVTCWSPGGGFATIATSSSDDIRISAAWFDVANNAVVIHLTDIFGTSLSGGSSTVPSIGSRLIFTRADGSVTEVNVKSGSASSFGLFEVYKDTHNYQVTLPWFNAYSFGNGVESNRIRDDYNQVTIDKGPKVSTVLEEPYIEERRSSGFIWSGIFNSLSGVNNLNQFIQAEKITKDLNPIHGSIQKLFARNTDLVTLCEDKVFKILANKDALYNADGNANLTASQNVLGQTIPFSGDHGISKNPESFAADAYRLYFSDRTRGSILRLSQDGITPISSYGMTDWFVDNLSESNRIIGSFDDRKKEYNISLSYYNQTVYPIRIMGTRKQAGSPVFPSARLRVADSVASKFHVGDEIVGPGIPIGTTIIEKIYLGGGVWEIQISHVPQSSDISTLGNHVCGDPDCLLFWWNSSVTTYTGSPIDPVTLSYSETSKGWPSFKSFHYEEALSLNNDYFTFKGGQLHQHHINDVHNNFYGEQYDSSVEVLFNEGPGIVKSFQSLDYEGSQSKVTSDGGIIVDPVTGIVTQEASNSGEYWDNYDKLGWYVDNMYTDLQELEPAEFKNKEGKWFSAIKGVATEWLDDGKAGNIDTHEFSYQGIDEAGAITVLDGGYTSWDCDGLSTTTTTTTGGTYCPNSSGFDTSNIISSSQDIIMDPAQEIPQQSGFNSFVAGVTMENDLRWFFDDPARHNYVWNNYYFITPNGTPYNLPYYQKTVFGCVNSVQDVLDYWQWKTDQNGWNLNFPAGMNFDNFLNEIYSVHTGNGATPDGWTNGKPVIVDAAFLSANGSGYANWSMGGPGDGVRYLTGPAGFGNGQYQFGCVPSTLSVSTTITIPGNCVEIQDLTGAYPDESTCLADPRSDCSGLCATPNVVTAHPTDASMPDCDDGTAAVEVYLAGTAASWTVKYVDTSGNETIDNTTYNYNGYSNPTPNLMQGIYEAVVTDDLGCEEVVEFVIDCTATTPCSSSNPHNFDPIFLTDPVWGSVTTIYNGNCWLSSNSLAPITGSGKIKISNNNLTPPATMWGVNIYSVVSGVSTMIFSSNWIYPGDVITIDGLEAGDYEYEIRDDQPCTYPPVPFTLNCTPFTACDPPTIPHGGYSITSATSNDGCTTDNGDGTHEITTVNLDPGSSTYTVQYYEISGPTWPAATATAIGPLQGPASGGISLSPPIGYYNLEAFSTNQQNYAVVITDNLNCELVQTFTVDCASIVTNPCAGYTSSSGPTLSYATTDATSNDCGIYDNGDGTHVIQSVSLQSTATWWTAEYIYDPNGANVSLTTGTLLQYNPTDIMVSANGSTGLGAGSYAVIITDSLGCSTTENFTIGCDDGVDVGQCTGPYPSWVSGVIYPDGDSVEHNGEYYKSEPSIWVTNSSNINIPPDQPGSYFSPCLPPITVWCQCASNTNSWNAGSVATYTGGNVVTYNNQCYLHNGDAYNGTLYYPGIYATGNSDPINPWIPCSSNP